MGKKTCPGSSEAFGRWSGVTLCALPPAASIRWGSGRRLSLDTAPLASSWDCQEAEMCCWCGQMFHKLLPDVQVGCGRGVHLASRTCPKAKSHGGKQGGQLSFACILVFITKASCGMHVAQPAQTNRTAWSLWEMTFHPLHAGPLVCGGIGA